MSMGFYVGRVSAAASLVLLMAAVTGPSAAQAEDCTLSIEQAWLGDYTAEASTTGVCGAGNVTLEVRSEAGKTVWSQSYRTEDLFGFEEVETSDQMAAALGDWLGANVSESSSADLPAWQAGADAPDAGEFPLIVEDGVTRDLYEQVRAENRPMVCYIQGHESLLCLLQHPKDGALQAIGIQTFPG